MSGERIVKDCPECGEQLKPYAKSCACGWRKDGRTKTAKKTHSDPCSLIRERDHKRCEFPATRQLRGRDVCLWHFLCDGRDHLTDEVFDGVAAQPALSWQDELVQRRLTLSSKRSAA